LGPPGEHEAASEAGKQESAHKARAAIKQHFEPMHKAMAQRKRELSAKVDKWERTRAKEAAKRRAKLAEAQTQLAAARKALQQQQHGRLSLSCSSSVAACQVARTVAVTGMQASGSNSIAFASEGMWVQVVDSLGCLERRMADNAAMTAAQRTLSLGDQFGSPCGLALDVVVGHIVVADCDSDQVYLWRAADGSFVCSLCTLGSGVQLQSP
jgi:hypothetical protein